MCFYLFKSCKNEQWPEVEEKKTIKIQTVGQNEECRNVFVKIICYFGVTINGSWFFQQKSNDTKIATSKIEPVSRSQSHSPLYIRTFVRTTASGKSYAWNSFPTENEIRNFFSILLFVLLVFFLLGFFALFQYKWQTKNGKHINKRA